MNVDVPTFDVLTFNVPTFDVPTFDVPTYLPTFEAIRLFETYGRR